MKNEGAAEDYAPQFETYDEKEQRLEQERKLNQNMPAGVMAAILVGLLCAALWTIFTVLTKNQLGIMPWGVGIAVGYVMRKAGKGVTPLFGIVAAIIAIFMCVLGDFLSNIAFIAPEFGIGFWEMLRTFNYSMTFTLMKETTGILGIFFYLIAAAAAFGIGYSRD